MKRISLLAVVALLVTAIMTGCSGRKADATANLVDTTMVQINKIDPPYWFVGKKNPSLQVLL